MVGRGGEATKATLGSRTCGLLLPVHLSLLCADKCIFLSFFLHHTTCGGLISPTITVLSKLMLLTHSLEGSAF